MRRLRDMRKEVKDYLSDGFCELCGGTLGTEECVCENITKEFTSSLTSEAQDINEVMRKVEEKRNILNAEILL